MHLCVSTSTKPDYYNIYLFLKLKNRTKDMPIFCEYESIIWIYARVAFGLTGTLFV